MAYVWNPSTNSALKFVMDTNAANNIAQTGETPTGTKNKTADIFNPDITADNAVIVHNVFAELFGFIGNVSAMTKTDVSEIDYSN